MKRDILAAVADGAMTTHPSRPAGRGSKRRRDTLEFGVKLLFPVSYTHLRAHET